MATEKYEAELGELKEARRDVLELTGKIAAASREMKLAIMGGSSHREAAAKFNIDDLELALKPAKEALADALKDIDSAANALLDAARKRKSNSGNYDDIVEEKKKAIETIAAAK